MIAEQPDKLKDVNFIKLKLFSKFDLIILTVLCILLLDSNLRLTVTEYDIASERLPSEFEGYKIVQLSDLHTMEFGNDNSRLVNRVSALQPDLIALTGDYIEEAEDIQVVNALVKQLSEIAPVYFTSGNHDWASKAIKELEAAVDNNGGSYLSNEHLLLERDGASIVLTGVEDPNGRADMPKPDEVCEAIDAAYPDSFILLMAHRNDFPERYPDLPCDVVFTGHGHGGVIRLPIMGGLVGTDLKLFPTYDAGLFESGRYTMVVSRGLGGAPFYPRLLNNPEIVVVTLHQK